MRYWSIVLHFYQPPTQESGIIKEILESCYLPLLRMLSEKSGFKITLNISGSLLVQLKELGADEFFELVKKLIDDGKIEIVNSVMYHPLMPLTPEDTILRQIEKNSQTLKNLLGVDTTNGFFPPELAVDNASLDIIKSSYIIVDETGFEKKTQTQNAIVKYNKKYLLINNRQVCDLMRNYPKQLEAKTVIDLVKITSKEEHLLVMANDAELFGHHYSERLQVLTDLLSVKDITFITASEAVAKFGNQAPIISNIKASSWQNCTGFNLWNKSPLQKNYLKLIEMVYELTSGNLEGAAEDYFDKGNSSCYLYWLSNWPWWHPDLVGSGTDALIRAIRIAKIDNKKKILAEKAYHKFLSKMWQFQWSGKVEKNYQKFNQRNGS